MSPQKLFVAVMTVCLLMIGLAGPASAAVNVTRAELKGGNEIRVEGTGAEPNATITIDGVAMTSADGNGEFEVREGGFSSTTCVIAVGDGATVQEVTLSGCTPTTTPPPPPPPPNEAPTANAGVDQTVLDADNDGTQSATLDGSASSDPDGTISSATWHDGAAIIANGTTAVVELAVGVHNIDLTVTDNEGATATDAVVVIVNSPSGPANQTPTANAGPDQNLVDTDEDGFELVTLDATASIDVDGTIVSFDWLEGGVPLGGGASAAPVAADVSADWTSALARGLVSGEYAPSDAGRGLQAPNRSHDLRTYFSPTGIAVEARTAPEDGPIVSLSLSALTRGEVSHPIGPALVTVEGTTVKLTRGGLVEWYDNSSAGLEQGFTLATRPAGAARAQPLVFDITVTDAIAELAGADVILTTSSGRVLRYSGLISYDARGASVASHIEVPSTDTIRLVIDDRAAVYPLVVDPILTGTFDHQFESNQVATPGFIPNAFGGSISSAGDVNGDGFDDVIIGAVGWDGGDTHEGAAFVFLGSATGIVGNSPSTAHARIESNQFGAQLGTVSGSVVGDINNDGFDDIVVGSHNYDSLFEGQPLEVNGAAFVFLGSAVGITGTDPTNADATILARELGSELGVSVSGAGDVNGDGFADIVIGVPGDGTPFPSNIPPNQRSGDVGAALVFHGGPAGITGTGFGDADAVITAYDNNGLTLPDRYGNISRVWGAGDVNGDGFSDIVVSGSEVAVFFGGPAGIGHGDLLDANSRVQPGGPQGFDPFTLIAAGAGDVNGDGFADIVAGSPFRDAVPFTHDQEGAAWIFHGSATGLTATDTTQANTSLVGSLLAEWLGWSVSGAGDIDNDGFDDVLIAAREYPGSLTSEGVAYLFRGSSTGVVAATTLEADARLEARQAGAVTFTNHHAFGVSTAGDVNGDGFADVIMGEGYWDGDQLDEGAAFLWHGSSSAGGTNIAPIPNAGADQTVFDVNLDGFETVVLDGTASSDPDGTIVAYEWWEGDILLGTGAVISPTLPVIGQHQISLVVIDDQGLKRGDAVLVHVLLPETSFVFNENFDTLGSWTQGGDSTLVSFGTFPTPPQARLGSSGAFVQRSMSLPAGTTGIDVNLWVNGSGFAAGDTVEMAVSIDGGPFVTSHTWTSSDVNGTFVFYGGSAIPGVGRSWYPNVATTAVIEFRSLTTTGIFLLDDVVVTSIQAPTGQNATPVAVAGPDQILTDADGDGIEAVTLSGTGSTDAEGPIASYVWREGSTTIGTTATITSDLTVGAHTLTLIVTDSLGLTASDTVLVTVGSVSNPGTLVTSLSVGTHVIELIVTDDQGATATDQVIVTVQAPTTNSSPLANAGPDQTIVDTDGNTLEVVTYDGTASADPDGSIVAYTWTKGSTPYNNAPTFSLTENLGVHVVTLTVTDNQGATASDTVVITIVAPDPPPSNQAPVANAGPDQTVVDTDGDGFGSVLLDGTGSSDPDGLIGGHGWADGITPLGTSAIQGAGFPVGTHIVTLTVTDDQGATATDTVIITVEAAEPTGTAAAQASISGPTSVRRGDSGTWTVTVTNTGTAGLTDLQVRFSTPSGRRLKNLSPGSLQTVATLAPGATTTLTWSASGDKRGSGTITATVELAGTQLASATHSISVVK